MRPYVPLDYLRTHFRVVDPEVKMEREMSHHCEGPSFGNRIAFGGGKEKRSKRENHAGALNLLKN